MKKWDTLILSNRSNWQFLTLNFFWSKVFHSKHLRIIPEQSAFGTNFCFWFFARCWSKNRGLFQVNVSWRPNIFIFDQSLNWLELKQGQKLNWIWFVTKIEKYCLWSMLRFTVHCPWSRLSFKLYNVYRCVKLFKIFKYCGKF